MKKISFISMIILSSAFSLQANASEEGLFDIHAYPGIVFVGADFISGNSTKVEVRDKQGDILGSALPCKKGKHAVVRLPADTHGDVTIEFGQNKQTYHIPANSGGGHN